MENKDLTDEQNEEDIKTLTEFIDSFELTNRLKKESEELQAAGNLEEACEKMRLAAFNSIEHARRWGNQLPKTHRDLNVFNFERK